MRTLIFDIDGTLTDMQPLEDPVLRAKQPRPILPAYQAVGFIKQSVRHYHFVYATGGSSADAEYALRALGIWQFFDIANSTSRSNCRFAKVTGIPYRRIKRLFPDSLVITDSPNDIVGAAKAGLPAILLKTNDILVMPAGLQ